jgi:UDP-N-acetyl-D-glucosamine dehydrogenase
MSVGAPPAAPVDDPSLDPVSATAWSAAATASGRPVVVVQGLGFVGAAMAAAVASAVGPDGEHAFTVIGVDRDDPSGRERASAINEGRFPFETNDPALAAAVLAARERRNLVACVDPGAYALADTIVVDVPLDIDWRADPPTLRLAGFEAAITAIGDRVRPGTLVLVETTVPPGTTEKVVVPLLAERLRARGIDPDEVLVGHSYERVMPGADYLTSIVDYWRVYAGHTDEAAKAIETFLGAVINVDDHPLTRVSSTTASETAKVLENTFRATTIALMDEWGRFAEMAGVDLFEVVDAIRVRPTHANLRSPGFGVGGYCLTKDPLFARLASEVLFDQPVDFPFSTAAVRTNDAAPLRVVEMAREMVGGDLSGRHVLLLGVSYRQDVGDTRYSPAETFARAVLDAGARLSAHDPLLDRWDELAMDLPSDVPVPDADVVVLAVPHQDYRDIDVESWLGEHRPVVVDAWDVWSDEQRRLASSLGSRVASIGRGPVPRPAAETRENS